MPLNTPLLPPHPPCLSAKWIVMQCAVLLSSCTSLQSVLLACSFSELEVTRLSFCGTTSLKWIFKAALDPSVLYVTSIARWLRLTAQSSCNCHCLQAWSFLLIPSAAALFYAWLTSMVITLCARCTSFSTSAIVCSHLCSLCLCRPSLSLHLSLFPLFPLVMPFHFKGKTMEEAWKR